MQIKYDYSNFGGFMKINKKMILSTIIMGSVILSGTVYADVYKKENLIHAEKEAAGGGEGILYGAFAFTRDQPPRDHAIKEIGWMTLQPGASIGYHPHTNNEDAYIIVSGEGVFTDADGQEKEVKAGDVTIARKGDSHALKNTGTEDLIFLDIIAEQ